MKAYEEDLQGPLAANPKVWKLASSRLESYAMPEASERQTMEIQFISPEKVVTSTLSVTLGPALPSQSGKFGRQRLVPQGDDSARRKN
jgi:hypothetical protein